MPPAARVLYVGLQMPQNTFLAVAITMAAAPLYAHYTSTGRTWGPTPLEDQQAAGGIMWLGGDLAFLAVVILLVLAWMRADERRTLGEDRRLAAEEAAIRERAARLAARRAAEAGERGEG
jgi:putative copper resistance protein D